MESTDFAIVNSSLLPRLPEIVLENLPTNRPVCSFLLILLATTFVFGSIMKLGLIFKRLRPVELHNPSVVTVLGTAGILEPLGFMTVLWAIDKLGVYVFILCILTLQAAGLLKIAGICGLAKAMSLLVFYGVLDDTDTLSLFQYRILELSSCLLILPVLFVPIPSLQCESLEPPLIPK
ncbi:hypothetical protein B9G98_03407 [Wickerhamiella sorbophila]|uniref:Uncharacterized protein n=1 Tax=Wickerhamiella sorbophila TaxID=45607 RepID=A0A2T0FLE4_9ASCO|nr:hypothetical protein B9G98_03407 [Wickerhamiella sorbophila]PRT55787.1 hypothetical protein B9G98_03407 [Wickerhamiella sorbophila]